MIEAKKRLALGILAHVDAGKTTLSEALLYTGGARRRLGRVDHGDAFLDNVSIERERGITIFSKQAKVTWGNTEFVLLDTPGHVDLGAEMERTLQALDYCILVVSGSDGVQGHTGTLWRLLARYQVPTFLFVNKMDQPGADSQKRMEELRERLDGGCMDFGRMGESAFWEEMSLCGEELLEEYLEQGRITDRSIASAVCRRQVFPCFFGSALQLIGVEELLEGLERFSIMPDYPRQFGAKVYKISRDKNGVRLTHLKVTGGVLRVKMPISNAVSAPSPEQVWEEKANQLRLYNGAQYSLAEQVEAGEICAVTGLEKTYAGQGLGREPDSEPPFLSPVTTYRLFLPEGCDEGKALAQLRQLEEEEPELHLVWKEAVRELHVQMMGEVQMEILTRLIRERFGLKVRFGDGSIVYRETIAAPAVGIGHFEPLGHYAEVQLLLEPGEPGSGIRLESACSQDVLDKSWQRLILNHLRERTHPGVLTGSAVTDMKIILLTGRAHLKHTEGGDFRQAAYRALRQGLMSAECVLLEPVFAFELEVPAEQLGRAMSDIRRMQGAFGVPATQGGRSVLRGSVPVSEFGSYQQQLRAYTRGEGRMSCTLKGYEPCHNQREVMEKIGYDPETDVENPSSSVFCAHGAGFVVSWDQAPLYAHVENGWKLQGEGQAPYGSLKKAVSQTKSTKTADITQEEIQEIFRRTYKKDLREDTLCRYRQQKTGTLRENAGQRAGDVPSSVRARPRQETESYLLVDGYNIIFAWEELRSLAAVSLDSARDRLMDICCNYQGYAGGTLILVYDAYKVRGGTGSVQAYHNIYVVYTKEAETADQYIEKTVHKIGKKHRVTVATSDSLEQMIVWGEGAFRLSAAAFEEAVRQAQNRMREQCEPQSRAVQRITLPEE